MKSELIVAILRWVVDNNDLQDIIGRGPFLHVCNKMSAAGQEKNTKNSRKMRGREKNFLSIINDQSKTMDQPVVPDFRY